MLTDMTPVPPRLDVWETFRVLRVARGGRLVPWLGPALRGLAGGRLRARACVLPVADQLGRWARCAGCPHMTACAYGSTFEPDPPPVRLPAGWADVARPLVIAPTYPCPPVAHVGDEVPVRVTFVGPAAAGHAAAFWDALRVGGADPMLGLGEDRVLFDVLPAGPGRTEAVELPADPAAVGGVAARVRVELTGPLVLNTAGPDGGRRRLVERPGFADLVRAGLRVLGPLFRCFGSPLPEDAFGRVKGLASGVPTVGAEWRVVGQAKSSHRTGDRWEVRGVVGWAEYGPLPAGLLPWLVWAGRLHVGTHRVAGAGGWKVEVAGAEPCDS